MAKKRWRTNNNILIWIYVSGVSALFTVKAPDTWRYPVVKRQIAKNPLPFWGLFRVFLYYITIIYILHCNHEETFYTHVVRQNKTTWQNPTRASIWCRYIMPTGPYKTQAHLCHVGASPDSIVPRGCQCWKIVNIAAPQRSRGNLRVKVAAVVHSWSSDWGRYLPHQDGQLLRYHTVLKPTREGTLR